MASGQCWRDGRDFLTLPASPGATTGGDFWKGKKNFLMAETF